MKRLLGSLLGGLFGLFVGPVMAQPVPQVRQADTWCPAFQMAEGQSQPTASSVLAWPTESGMRRFLCLGQSLRSPGGFYGLLVNATNGELDAVRGNDPNDIVTPISPGRVVNGASYYLSLSRPVQGALDLVGFAIRDDSTREVIWRNLTPAPVDPRQGAFIEITDDAVQIVQGTPGGDRTVLTSIALDEVVSFELHDFNYMLEKVYLSTGEPVAGTSVQCKNQTANPVTCALTLSLSYSVSKSFQFGFKQGLKLTQKFTGGITVPFLAEAKSETSIELALETSQTWTDSTSDTQTFTLQFTVPTPGHSVYAAQINATKYTGNLPYAASGIATYKSGKQKVIQQSPGIWAGSQTFNFQAVTKCISAPGGCPPSPMAIPLQATSAGVLVPRN